MTMAKSITLTSAQACALLPPREDTSHKGSFGRLLCVCGSLWYPGAAALSVTAALHGGAGIVTLASLPQVTAGVLPLAPEATVLPLEASEEGRISEKNAPRLLAQSERATALLIGCGLGLGEDTARLVGAVLKGASCRLVLDADALNALEGNCSLLDAAALPPIVTPHIGEMARLTGLSAEQIKADAAGTALAFAKQHRCVALLKDADTVVAAPDGRLLRYQGRNAGLARGGSGDLLAGLMASFAAQGTDSFEAAAAAVVLHGESAKRCAARRSKTGMQPHELLDDLCEIFSENGR